MNFSILSPAKLIFGKEESYRMDSLIPESVKKVLIIHGKSLLKNSTFDEILSHLDGRNILQYQIPSGEPCPESVDAAAEFAGNAEVEAVIGIGGGSVMDTAKAVSALITNGGQVIDYLEGVGVGKKVVKAPLPLFLVPTTAGTGTEATKNAVVSSINAGFKKSMRDDSMIANAAVIDPLLTKNMPRPIMAASGMDAICQLVESYTTKNANPFTDALALYHAGKAVRALPLAYEADDESARLAMGIAALVSGITLANAGLGIAHGLASGIGAVTNIPHGIACGILLPVSMRFNIDRGIDKYADLGEVFEAKSFNNKQDACTAAIDYIEGLNARIGIPKDFKSFGLTLEQANKVAEASMGSSMSKNPVAVSLDDCMQIMRQLV